MLIVLIILLGIALIVGYHGIYTLIFLRRMGIYRGSLIPNPKRVIVDRINMVMSNMILEHLEKEKNPKQTFGDILDFVAKVFKADSWSLLLTPKEKRWYFYVWSDKLNKLPLDEIAESLQRKGRHIKEVLEKKDVMVIKDTRKYPYWCKGAPDVITWMGVPLILKGEIFGVLSLDWFKKRYITKFEIELLRKISNYIEEVVIKVLKLNKILLDARIDSITEIYNRRSLEIEIQKYEETDVGIIFIDVDDFKKMNDLYGHAIGDDVLKIVARRIKRCIREEDNVFRYGGDEFVVLVKNANEEILKIISERIKSVFERPVKVDDNSFKISISVGFAIYPREAQSLKEAIRIADERMYKDKSSKKSSKNLG